MLIKFADSRDGDLETLRALLERPDVEGDKKRDIEREIRTLQSGLKGEREAAYEIDFHYGPSKNWAVIHDLRIEHAGRVAQIDHLLINRVLELYVCESKRFSEGIAINELGECSAFCNGKQVGVPSPFEQNRKHIEVLAHMCSDGIVALPKRLGVSMKPQFKSLVLISKNARITRPKKEVAGLNDILKVDQIKTRIDRAMDTDTSVLAIAKLIGSDTLQELAATLAAQHKPITFACHARFGLPKDALARSVATHLDNHPNGGEPKKARLVCSTCGAAVSYSVAKFCWFNKPRFGGKVFCMTCQRNIPAV
jgi:hypothetical protein